MKRFTTLRAEFSALFQKRMTVIALIAIMFIPVLYAGTYLYAFKDPYGKLDHLPVAVVNLDKGTTYEGKALTVGEDFVEKLKEKDSFQWHFVNEEKAEQGLKDNKYYMVIRIPNDFSENATTLMDEHPKHLELAYIPNKAYNFLAAQIGNSAVEKMKEEISATITETYTEDMFDSIAKVSDGLQEAGDGAGKLRDGGTDAKDGAEELHTHLQELAEKSISFQNGLSDAKNGSQEIAANLNLLTDKSSQFQQGMTQEAAGLNTLSSKLGELSNGLGQLQDGQKTLSENALKLQKGTTDVSNGLGQSLAGLNEINGKLPAAKEGAAKLAAGAASLSKGSLAWKDSAESVGIGATEAAAGADKVTDGLAQLQIQVEAMPEPYKSQLQPTIEKLLAQSQGVKGGTAQVAEGTKTLAVKAGEIAGGANGLASGTNELQGGIGQLQAGVQAVTDAQKQLVTGATALVNGQTEYMEGFELFGRKLSEATKGSLLLATGAADLDNGMGQLTSASAQMGTGVQALANGAAQLTGGVAQLKDGSDKLADGTEQLADGSGKLTDGLSQITDGAGELSTKLSDAAKETSEASGSKETYEMFAKPVNLVTKDFGEAINYATGVAPYFMSLGLYVGSIMLTVIYPLREAAGVPKSGFSWFISKYAVILIMGTMQSLIVDGVVLLGLDIHVTSVPHFMLFTFLTSITFLSLIQFLVTAFGDVGRFAAILLLIIQLVASAGTYPVELVADALQVLAPYVPMTYSVSGFRAIISADNIPLMWDNAFVLAGGAIVSVVGTITYFTVAYRRQFKQIGQAELVQE